MKTASLLALFLSNTNEAKALQLNNVNSDEAIYPLNANMTSGAIK
jgi:hypothetical protein